jgi:hypothetical protein
MDTMQETRIYKNYRAALASLTANTSDSFTHAAQRRQSARKVTVDRYNVPYAELKRIISTHDTVNGITHEKGEDYYQKMEYENAVTAYEANPTPCHCGSTKMVRVRVDPYYMEIHNEFKLGTLCYECYREVEGDV